MACIEDSNDLSSFRGQGSDLKLNKKMLTHLNKSIRRGQTYLALAIFQTLCQRVVLLTSPI
ncbi:CNT_collapsed_G0054970.mRNA.1.CDS.1 [Saccharomyces cerevisiae]|nr:CNT_collapsed_G0054970.mRNA.1.CDS.1 [Saccharomyces cerevisiae]